MVEEWGWRSEGGGVEVEEWGWRGWGGEEFVFMEDPSSFQTREGESPF